MGIFPDSKPSNKSAEEAAGLEPVIEENCDIAEDVRVWGGSLVRSGAKIGNGTSIGRNVYVGPSVQIGSGCKIQNNALIYEPATLEDGVFIGPGVVLTNDRVPRARNIDGVSKTASDWSKVGVHIKNDASLGAGVVCVGPVTIGRWAMVAAGSVVTKDVLSFSLVAGVPARHIGWVGRDGVRLSEVANGNFVSPSTGLHYYQRTGERGELVLEEQPTNGSL